MSGLLHALVGMCANHFGPPSHPSVYELEEEALPVTSYACQWKPPRKRKLSTLPISEAKFEKHVYGRKRKAFKPLEDFDPRPSQYHNTAPTQLTQLLTKVHGKGL